MNNQNEEKNAITINETPETYCIICQTNDKTIQFKGKDICKPCISDAITLK